MTRGNTHTALMHAISQALIAQHPEADGNEPDIGALAIPIVDISGVILGRVVLDVSALAEACLAVISPEGEAAGTKRAKYMKRVLTDVLNWAVTGRGALREQEIRVIREALGQAPPVVKLGAWLDDPNHKAFVAGRDDVVSPDPALEAAHKRVAALEEWVIMAVGGLNLSAETLRLRGDLYGCAAISTMALCVQMGSGVQMPAPKAPGQ